MLETLYPPKGICAKRRYASVDCSRSITCCCEGAHGRAPLRGGRVRGLILVGMLRYALRLEIPVAMHRLVGADVVPDIGQETLRVGL